MDDSRGKPFLVLHYRLRQCLVCGGVFCRPEASTHSRRPCGPQAASNRLKWLEYSSEAETPQHGGQRYGEWNTQHLNPTWTPISWRPSSASPVAGCWNSSGKTSSLLTRLIPDNHAKPIASDCLKSLTGCSG